MSTPNDTRAFGLPDFGPMIAEARKAAEALDAKLDALIAAQRKTNALLESIDATLKRAETMT